ncbi:MAG: hypothetical protein ABSH04_07770, partial [Acidimicrobiales bacterium]
HHFRPVQGYPRQVGGLLVIGRLEIPHGRRVPETGAEPGLSPVTHIRVTGRLPGSDMRVGGGPSVAVSLCRGNGPADGHPDHLWHTAWAAR